MWKKLLKGLLVIVLVLVLALAAGIGYLSLTEYRPDEVEQLAVDLTYADRADAPKAPGMTLRVLTFNTGYAGLGAESDFFMDGGKQTHPESEQTVEKNEAGILDAIRDAGADVVLLQEVDRHSTRSFYHAQTRIYPEALDMVSVFAANYQCAFVPYPWPPLGAVDSGLVTLTGQSVLRAERDALPCPFSWPLRVANLKRCLLVSYLPVEGTESELVIINLHLEAYDDGEGRKAQAEALLGRIEEEYQKGNYVIAGGDFNASFPGTLENYPVIDPETWQPGQIEIGWLPEGYTLAYDPSKPTCRLLNFPYDAANPDTQYYVIDGFILSPNVILASVETIDAGFAYSDHNPVLLTVTLEDA